MMLYLIWLINDDFDENLLVGVGTSKEKALAMKEKLQNAEGFEECNYEITKFEKDKVIINDIEYCF